MSWINIKDEKPPLDEFVFFEDQDKIRWIGCRVMVDHEHWLYSNSYGSFWWDKKEHCWRGDKITDDDYQPVKWHKLPK